MKTYLTFLFFLLIISVDASEFLSLKEACSKGLISYEVSSNSNSTHYYKPLKISIKNLKNFEVRVKVVLGTVFSPEDSIYQKFIITKEELLCLKPLSESKYEVFAMCIESSDIAPLDGINYFFANEDHKKLLPLLKLIQDKSYFKPEGQYAVWAAINQISITGIYGADTIAEKELIQLVADITNQPVPVRTYNSDNYINNFYSDNLKIKMGGTFDYKLSQAKSISIAMFDKNNVIVRELFYKEKVNAGTHHFEYFFDASVYTDDFYYVRLIADGHVKIEIKIDMPKR